jgi:lipopolysaccharide transport system ATP-binding protein
MTKAEINRKFDEMVAFAEVERFIDTPVKRYSSGMKVRLAFAVAAHLEPEVMLVDEVLAVGDAAFQAKCIGKMQDVAGQGRTVLFVSHNMAAVNRLCSRALLLHDGRLVQEGPTSEVTAAYLTGAYGGVGRLEWDEKDAPGDQVRLLAVSLTDAEGRPVSTAAVHDELTLSLRYQVERPGLAFRCAATWSTQGTTAFSSVEPSEEVRPRAGVYTSTLKIPAHLLAEGEYSVMVSIFASRGVKSHYVTPRHVLMVQISDPLRGDSARGDYAENLSGVMRPRLDWKIQQDA